MHLEPKHNNERGKNQMLLRAKDISLLLNISRSYAYLLMQSGELPTVRLGRSIRVQPKDLEEYLKRNTHNGFDVNR